MNSLAFQLILGSQLMIGQGIVHGTIEDLAKVGGYFSLANWSQIAIFALLLLCLTPPLGIFMANVFEGKRTFLHPVFGWLERLTYKVGGVNPAEEMTWVQYAKGMVLFNLLGFVAIFLLERFQYFLPLNPEHLTAVPWLLAFNTAASFMTNTNWQAYTPETTMSYATQMLGLTVQNFLSAATGCAVLLALMRGISRKSVETIGNFWTDVVRCVVYVLIPLSIVWAVVLVSQGVVQTFAPYVDALTLEGVKQTIPLGPAASQIAIKQLGSNGGGFFNANSTHPFENPTLLTNFFEMFALIWIPAALVYTYGIMIDSKRHAWALFFVMLFLWSGGLALSFYSEHLANPSIGVTTTILEGKEVRLGVANSLLWATSTTASANGSVNVMHSSLSPLAGGVALFNMMLGEIVFGGIGVGLCGMLVYVLFTVFLSGLMVGRTPEYMGKKIEKQEVKWVMIAILMSSGLILLGTAAASVLPSALTSLGNQGPHGFTEILYAFTSAAENNGSSFAGLNANTGFYNGVLGVVMLVGRFAILIPSLALAGNLAAKKRSAPSVGTFSTDTFLFVVLLVGNILIVGALTFFPALCLGPLIEHLLMLEGRVF